VPVYAYEVDGRGGVLLADDANTPSLLALPLTGWCRADDPLYLATRDLVLSPANPYYYRGSAASGIGSPHTPEGHVWPIALAIQGLTSTDPAERRALLDLILATDDGTGAVHESFHADDPGVWTREWFSWANSMFCELALETAGLRTYRRPAPDHAPDSAPGSAS
jgi:meiotically up-regulated gene 157 (Mug157) protein